MKRARIVGIFLLLIAVTLLTLSNTLADTYTDIEISIGIDGRSTISGSSNVAIGQISANESISGFTDSLTSKKQSVWTFALMSNGSVNLSLVKVHLPQGVTISGIKSSQSTLIADDEAIVLTFIGRNEPINITIQYTLELVDLVSANKKTAGSQYGWYAIIAAFAVIIIGAITLVLKRRGLTKKIPDSKKLAVIRPTLNETQLKIIDTLIACGGVATQNKIHHATQIPKASLSRNVDLLVQKQVLSKQSGGYTNQLSFHESYFS